MDNRQEDLVPNVPGLTRLNDSATQGVCVLSSSKAAESNLRGLCAYRYDNHAAISFKIPRAQGHAALRPRALKSLTKLRQGKCGVAAW